MDYLYNGVRLPELPEWDREKYPYALIGAYPNEDGYGISGNLYLTSKVEFGYNKYNVWSIATEYIFPFDANSDYPTEWQPGREYSGSPGVNVIDWANFDLLDEDGSVYLAASEPVPVDPDEPLYRDNATITLGSGTLYLTEYDGETLPDVETVCVEENRMGYTKGGAALQYTEETTEERDDLGYVSKIITTKTDVVLKCGLITWNAYTLYKLIDRCTVEIQDGKRVVKIGGKGNENGNKYVVVFHHEDPIDGDLWALIVGRNTAGFTITCTNEAGALIEPEFKALPHDTDGTLVRLIEGSRGGAA